MTKISPQGYLYTKSEFSNHPFWEDGGTGGNVPAGGTTGQALVKKSDADYDTEWKTIEGGGTVEVDTELSINSTNPVENRVITGEINTVKNSVSTIQEELSGLGESLDEATTAIDELGMNKADKSDTVSPEQLNTKLEEYDTSEDVNLKLQDFYTKEDTYSKTELDTKFGNTVSTDTDALVNYYTKSETYNKNEVNELLEEYTPSLQNYYTKNETNELLNGKVDNSTYTAEVDALNQSLNGKTDNTAFQSFAQTTSGDITTLINNVATLQQTVDGFDTDISNKVDKPSSGHLSLLNFKYKNNDDTYTTIPYNPESGEDVEITFEDIAGRSF